MARWIVLVVGLVVVALGLWVAVQEPPAPPTSGVLTGLCEASAIVATPDGYLVGDNEDEDLLHRYTRSFEALPDRRLSARVEDVEAVTYAADGRLLIVGSQSASKGGEPRPDREKVLLEGVGAVRPDLAGCAACEGARGLPPKEGGLSIEGAAVWGGATWLGVRSPVPEGRALLLRMEGSPPGGMAVAEVVRVDLGGAGVRDLVVVDGALVVLAGPPTGAEQPHQLYRIASPGAPPEALGAVVAGAEGIVVEGNTMVVVTDGDGKPGKPCVVPATWQRLAWPPG